MKETLPERLVRHEGLSYFPYRCPAGKLTIGVGRNLEDNGLSHDEVMFMLYNDIQRCQNEVYERLPFFYYLEQTRKDILIEMCFNLGITKLMEFKKMIIAMRRGDYKAAAAEMLDSEWSSQVGERAEELAEAMEKGEFSK